MKTEHTPTPWESRSPLHEGYAAAIIGHNGQLVVNLGDGGNGRGVQLANAAIIVQGVNSHAGLTAQVADLESLLAQAVPWISKAQADGAYQNCASPYGAEKLLAEIRALLLEEP